MRILINFLGIQNQNIFEKVNLNFFKENVFAERHFTGILWICKIRENKPLKKHLFLTAKVNLTVKINSWKKVECFHKIEK